MKSLPLSCAWIVGVVTTLAVFAVGCAAPTAEEEQQGSTESSIVSAGGGACPVAARLSQGFSKSHDGIDLANKIGTPIFAVAAGVVTASGPAQGYGQWIRIKHDDGSMTEYGHMSRRDVQVGARVKAGQRIALVGSEGHSTGPHLHLRAYRSASNVGSGKGMNPVDFLSSRGVSLPCTPSGVQDGEEETTAPAPEGSDGKSDGTVDVWKTTELRETPANDASAVATAAAKQSYTAVCWMAGEMVTSNGYSHDKWVKIEVDGSEGFISGVYLKGDETGGVTKECE